MKTLLAIVVLVLIAGALVLAFAPRPRDTNQVLGTSSPISASNAPSATATSAPASTSQCQIRGVLPDPVCTPGATDPRVNQDNIATTICVSGYTASVRPPTGYTTPLERELIRRYGLTGAPADYELDHLIPLELGGDPWDLRNLFPQAYEPRPGAREKDQVENGLHADVCAGRLSLAEAQRRIATDWTTSR